jgi:outer membrane protein assembly factor BamE
MKIRFTLIVPLGIAILTGCAQMGPTASNAGNTVGEIGASAFNAAKGLGGSLFAGYTTGVEVTPEQMAQFQKDRTTRDQVISSIGHPPTREVFNGREVWKYHYTHISHFGQNVNEDTVFEFNNNGTLHSSYKTGGSKGKSGNPLLDAAGY